MKKLFALALTLLTLSTSAIAGTPPATNTSLAPMLQNVMPSVVNLVVSGIVSYPLEFAPPPEAPGPNKPNEKGKENAPPAPPPMEAGPGGRHKFQNLGSGVITDAKNGYILTNAHVVAHAQTITVTLSDGHLLKARLIGADPASDVAVIQVEPGSNLTAITMGNSDDLHVGDFVAAIGNPYGLEQTVTSGIISALQRNNLHIEGYENFIQTDASINPGNSGGALVNMQGQLIGINTAILAPDGAPTGIGFAIPVNMARSVMEQLIQYGSVKRGSLGVLVQNMTPALANAFHLPSKSTGALVTQVVKGSPADLAGLKSGDLIISVNGRKITDAGEVRNTVGLLRMDDSVRLEYIRNGKTQSMKLTIADPNKYLEAVALTDPFLYGAELRDFDQVIGHQGQVKGVQILNPGEDTAAWRAGVREGDVIISANNMPVTNMNELKQAVSKDKNQLLVNILRRGGALFIVIN